jgi:hypothetical protein
MFNNVIIKITGVIETSNVQPITNLPLLGIKIF